ncbi:dihydrofolate reductase [Buchnera aphidicola (Mindarus keteleerifoliae)]|uniref:dihydrofolate reductase n=1 Tax=Buchnera aphidicola TaxID=9 RepID=UPI0031B6C035
MTFSLIVAVSNNLVIGFNGKIPWYLPEDLLWFKKNTIHKFIVMGRKTWESINCKPLSFRKNIIISSNPITTKGIISLSSIDELLKFEVKNKKSEIMIIGGTSIYFQMFPYIKKIYITNININVEGDAYFPIFLKKNTWRIIFQKESYFLSNLKKIEFCFNILVRKNHRY